MTVERSPAEVIDTDGSLSGRALCSSAPSFDVDVDHRSLS